VPLCVGLVEEEGPQGAQVLVERGVERLDGEPGELLLALEGARLVGAVGREGEHAGLVLCEGWLAGYGEARARARLGVLQLELERGGAVEGREATTREGWQSRHASGSWAGLVVALEGHALAG